MDTFRTRRDRIINDIRTLFEQEEDYYKLKKVSNFWKNNYIEYEGNGDKNRNLSVGEYLLIKISRKLETLMRETDFIFDSVELMFYKCHEVNFRRGGSYTDSPDWIKNKKATINPKNINDKCFQYATTVALNYEEIKSNPERVSNIKPFINK